MVYQSALRCGKPSDRFAVGVDMHIRFTEIDIEYRASRNECSVEDTIGLFFVAFVARSWVECRCSSIWEYRLHIIPVVYNSVTILAVLFQIRFTSIFYNGIFGKILENFTFRILDYGLTLWQHLCCKSFQDGVSSAFKMSLLAICKAWEMALSHRSEWTCA